MICRGCESSRTELILDLGMQPWGNDFIPIAENRRARRYPLRWCYCHACSMLQIDHTIAKEVMFVSHDYLSGTTRSLKLHFAGVAEMIAERATIGPRDYVLDVGGNDGTFLKWFKDRELNVINVDSGTKQAERSNSNGIPCLNRFFDDALALELRQTRGSAKVIHGSGIFFHLEELHSVFDGIRHLLDDDGVLVAEFIYLPEMVKKCAFDQIYHEHLLYYTLSTFSDLLNGHGLEIFDVGFSNIHGGTCIAFAGHPGRRSPSAKVAEVQAEERRAGYLDVACYRDFSVRAVRLKGAMQGTVERLRSEGQTIQTLGAPVKGTTIVNFCGLDERHLQCATEINELKFDTYLPGTLIPVVDQAKAPRPDVYLLLSWNFQDEILSNLQCFRAAGGRILVPIPFPELV
jgi:hypothetical protein